MDGLSSETTKHSLCGGGGPYQSQAPTSFYPNVLCHPRPAPTSYKLGDAELSRHRQNTLMKGGCVYVHVLCKYNMCVCTCLYVLCMYQYLFVARTCVRVCVCLFPIQKCVPAICSSGCAARARNWQGCPHLTLNQHHSLSQQLPPTQHGEPHNRASTVGIRVLARQPSKTPVASCHYRASRHGLPLRGRSCLLPCQALVA